MNKQERKIYMKEYYKNNKDKFNKEGYHKKWLKNNPNYKREYDKKYSEEYRKNNREEEKQRHKKYRKENKEKINRKRREYFKLRYKTNKDFKISTNLRNKVFRAFKYYTKTGKIMSSKEYGIDYKEIIEHLKPFPDDLKNYEIHHIKPLNTFNFISKDGSTNLKEIKKAFAPKNHKWVTKEEHKRINTKLNSYDRLHSLKKIKVNDLKNLKGQKTKPPNNFFSFWG